MPARQPAPSQIESTSSNRIVAAKPIQSGSFLRIVLRGAWTNFAFIEAVIVRSRFAIRLVIKTVCFALFAVAALAAPPGQPILVKGGVVDPQGERLPNADVHVLSRDIVVFRAISGLDGAFVVEAASPGTYVIAVSAPGFQTTSRIVSILLDGNSELTIQISRLATAVASVTVTADRNDLDVISPDPGEKVFVSEDLLNANPGRPGAPVSIPGYPIETASSGIKAPQYFAPGVAGDHGEPIGQFIAMGSYLVPNNLSANAHGNGYSDPNIFIPETLESVQVDGGAFNVREGNHAVNLAAIYGLRTRLDPFVTLTADPRDLDLAAGFSPSERSFVALDVSFGNGFLKRLEHRRQFKLNTQRIYEAGNHHLTLLGIGYYGSSYIPGLVPIFAKDPNKTGFPDLGDTIDPRQRDVTHTVLVALNDVWHLNSAQELQLSGFFRTYSLGLDSDFGQGLIRQSEFRTVAGSSANYIRHISESVSLLGGSEYNREAPRDDNLGRSDRPDPDGSGVHFPFTPIDSNNVTISSFTPYAAISGSLGSFVRFYAGGRHDQIEIQNDDLIHNANSFQKWVGVNSPKATVALLPKPSWPLPLLSLSFGKAFFTEDPRIGTGSAPGTPVATSRSIQLVASRTIDKMDFRLTLGHVSSSQQLAKIDPDTGLQQNQGPSRLMFATATVRYTFSRGSLLATLSKAEARDLDSGDPTPEAPRTIFDLLGNVQKLPLGLQARGEFEFVGRKPLGIGCAPDPKSECTGTSVGEFRAAAVRSFLKDRLGVGINVLVARGYTGQTTENFFPSDVQTVVGVRIPTYACVNVTYKFRRPETQ